MATLVLADDEMVSMDVEFMSAAGNPAEVDGVPVWSSSDPTILSVSAGTDGMRAVATAVGPLGTARVTVKADADMGAGMKEIMGVLDVEIVAGEAVAATIKAGIPEPQT